MNIVKTVGDNLKKLPYAKSWIFAYSGGVDSCVLTDIISKLKPDDVNLKLIHVNHGLGQKKASDWVKQAKETAERIGAEFITTNFNMDETKTGVEERARNLRHAFIESHVEEGDIVFMGHHKNDQAETLLFRLCRGTGLRGLSGISSLRKMGKGFLSRPMLDISRKEIVEYAEQNHINWFEDDTNVDLKFSRNFFRHKVIPLLESRYSDFIDKMKSLSEKAEESHLLLKEVAEADLKSIEYVDAGETKYLCQKLHAFSPLRQKNMISYLIETKLGINQENKNFNNTLKVLSSENKNCSKVRKLILKTHIIYNNGKFIWIEKH